MAEEWGHARYLLAEEKDLITLPQPLTWKDGCFISCGVGTVYEGVLRADISGSDNVAIVGMGSVGMATAMLAKGRGVVNAIGIDTQKSRLTEAERLQVIDKGFLASEDVLGKIKELTKGGASKTIDCSGSSRGRLLALQACAEWGKTVYLGETGDVKFNVSDDLLHQQRTVYGSWVTSLDNMEQCCEDLVLWNKHPDIIVTNTFNIEQASKAYKLMAKGQCGKIVIEP